MVTQKTLLYDFNMTFFVVVKFIKLSEISLPQLVPFSDVFQHCNSRTSLTRWYFSSDDRTEAVWSGVLLELVSRRCKKCGRTQVGKLGSAFIVADQRNIIRSKGQKARMRAQHRAIRKTEPVELRVNNRKYYKHRTLERGPD